MISLSLFTQAGKETAKKQSRMTEFTISLAGIPLRIQALYPSTRDYCRGYESEVEPEETVVSTAEKIMWEAQRCGTKEEPVFRISAQALERMAIHREIAEILASRSVLLFHASALAVDGEAILFSGKSGIGKSTHARLWREKMKDRVLMVNDDKPLLKVTKSDVIVYGSPWKGKEKLGNNLHFPVRAICFLERAEDNRINRISAWDAFPLMVKQSYIPLSNEKRYITIEMIERILAAKPAFRLFCNNLKPDAAEIACRGIGVQMT